MPDEYIDPVDNLKPIHPVEGGGRRPEGVPGPAASVSGIVIGVHRKSSRHEEAHRLDTSVGGQTYTELVLRVESGEIDEHELMGKRVVVNYRA